MAERDERALVLGGSGLVGYQVARRLAGQIGLKEVVIAALAEGETRAAMRSLAAEFPGTRVRGFCGDLFLPGAPHEVTEDTTAPPLPSRGDADLRRRMFDDLYRDFETAYRDSLLARLIDAVRPDVVVDSVNTATGISYQDVFTASRSVRSGLDQGPEATEILREDVEKLLISLSIPQLILHIRVLNRALREAAVRLYLKIGTTGTGGMGLNIPYTHGEDRPSPTLLNKTAVAFAQTGMLFLMGRTPGGPIVKELKPAALIGYRGVDYREAMGKQYKRRTRGERTEFELGDASEGYVLYRPKPVRLAATLDLTPDDEDYERLTAPDGSTTLRVPLVDTGENGLFTRGEFEAITALGQMEYITPEEIAEIAVMEVRGAGTGTDVIGAVDSAVLGSTYKAGLLRPAALEILDRLERETGVPSIALGRLGPPDLAKHLFECYLFRRRYRTLDQVTALGRSAEAAAAVSRELAGLLESDPFLGSLSTSIGIPILLPDGRTLLRGPVIKSPGYLKFRTEVPVGAKEMETYVLTWVDLRPARMGWWLETFSTIADSHFARREADWSTANVDRATYLSDDIEIGNVVAWIFSNQSGGFRVL